MGPPSCAGVAGNRATGSGSLVRVAEDITVGELTLVWDTGPGDWVLHRVRDFTQNVGSVVPQGFAAYARVFHPAARLGEPVSWEQVAAANGRMAHPGMEWTAITGSWRFVRGDTQSTLWDEEPPVGQLPEAPAARLAGVLAAHTSTPQRCWFGIWDGYAGLPLPATAPRLRLPQRGMYLLSGALSAVTTSLGDRRANLWWPDDRAWCVGTDIDLMTTYVGGSRSGIRDVVADDRLEALPVPVDQRVTWDSDVVNPLPER